MFNYSTLSLILKISLRIPFNAFGLLKTTTFKVIPPENMSFLAGNYSQNDKHNRKDENHHFYREAQGKK